MKLEFLKRGTALMTLAAFGAGFVASAAVAEVVLTHDKSPWQAGFEALGATAGFTASAYPTDQYIAFVQSSIAAGTTPAIFTWWTGSALADVVSSGAVASVDDVWDAAIASGDLPAGVRGLFSVDGTAYAVPINVARWVVLYNKQMFADNGIAEPTSWADLEAAAATLKAAGITPFEASVQDGWRGFIWFQEFMIRTNPDAYNKLHTGELAYDSPEVHAAFDMWVDWASKGYFTDPRTTTEAADFAGGSAAMYLMGEWVIGSLGESGMDIDANLGAFIMPNADPALPSQVIVEGGPLLLSASADDAAKAAYGFFVTQEGGQAWADALGLFNGNPKVPAPNGIIDEITADMTAGNTIALQRWWEAVPAAIQGDMVAELSAFVLNPTAEQADITIANLDAINKEYWAEQ